MTEDERQHLVGAAVSEAHTGLSEVAFKLRRELMPKAPALKAAIKAERETFRLKRELQGLDLADRFGSSGRTAFSRCRRFSCCVRTAPIPARRIASRAKATSATNHEWPRSRPLLGAPMKPYADPPPDTGFNLSSRSFVHCTWDLLSASGPPVPVPRKIRWGSSPVPSVNASGQMHIARATPSASCNAF